MEQILVDISADGTVKVEADGVRGQGCAALTKAIEAAIGRTSRDIKKPEFFQAVKQGANQDARNNAGR